MGQEKCGSKKMCVKKNWVKENVSQEKCGSTKM